MSRASRIPYHQNVYDLLQLEPGESPEAARMIAEHEAAHGPLPASVKEWYLVPNMVPLRSGESAPIWDHYINVEGRPQHQQPWPLTALEELLCHAAHIHWVSVMWADHSGWSFADFEVELKGSDPPVYCTHNMLGDVPNGKYAATFSDFIFNWFAESDANRRKLAPDGRESAQPHANGLWLRAPAEPFVPAVIDYLTEQLDEPQRTPRPGNVTTYTFRPRGGTIRVTADEPGLGGGLSAWWVHAESPERLADLARLVMPFGTLRETLRADTDPAREVLGHVLGERGA